MPQQEPQVPSKEATRGRNACPASLALQQGHCTQTITKTQTPRGYAFHLSHLSLSQQTEKCLAGGKHSLSGG